MKISEEHRLYLNYVRSKIMEECGIRYSKDGWVSSQDMLTAWKKIADFESINVTTCIK